MNPIDVFSCITPRGSERKLGVRMPDEDSQEFSSDIT